ncbi:hypothetical protein CROQUDRAFT_134960 [Cronartium quercuum f. sp. fusiforme G11]|uniref:Transmembrane protein n=1 Tax=Cronartium quercuum f. sp. fusiforme G11 TaxID=708437 RepID=A0A9P6T8X8_9BASI|nr:hypothetical protein CROQUDRAFT_134960 [Cronartium quercuum f. sp. fusiforme G11]
MEPDSTPPNQSTSLLKKQNNHEPNQQQEHQNYQTIESNQPTNPTQSIILPLPRPKLWLILSLISILDLFTTIYYIYLYHLDKTNHDLMIILNLHPNLIFSWNLSKAILLLIISTSRQIRSFGWIYAITGMISILLLIWTTNEYVQISHSNQIPKLFPILNISILLFFLPLLEWLGFLIIVGIKNSRNPFIGNSLGLGFSTKLEYWNWNEINDINAIERVILLEDDEFIETSNHHPNNVPEVEEVEESDQNSVTSSPTTTTTIEEEEGPDSDDIIDIPLPSIKTLSNSTNSTLRRRNRNNSWLAKQVDAFEQVEERRSLRRSSLPHQRTPSCSNACYHPIPPTSTPITGRFSVPSTPRKNPDLHDNSVTI